MALGVPVMLRTLCLIYILSHVRSQNISVNTKLGQIIGKIESVTIGPNQVSISQYLGIPYAEPPIKQLRFAKPEPKSDLGASYVATDYKPSCLQAYPGFTNGLHSEDCLYLNIFSPKLKDDGKKYTVMIYIHGGSFVFGDGKWRTFEKLPAFSGVILVTLNYRLGPFGFLRTEDGGIPGNMGLWDQHLAIKWVHENIESFGGDPNNITIFGESAGAACVMFQVIYPGNKGLFHRAISQSGSSNAPWSILKGFASKATALAKNLECPVENLSGMINCLRNVKNATKLMQKSLIGMSTTDPDWAPVIDDDFITQERLNGLMYPLGETKQELFRSLDLLIGTNGYESQNFIYQPPNTESYNVFLNSSASIDDIKLSVKNIMDRSMVAWYDEEMAETLLDDVLTQYDNYGNPSDKNLYIKNLLDMVTDVIFFVPANVAAQSHAFENKDTKTYQYEFNQLNPLSPQVPWVDGALHADDLQYVFGEIYDLLIAGNNTEMANEQWTLASKMMIYWTNFAKSGNPNSPVTPEVEWKEYSLMQPNYIYLTADKIENGVNLHGRRSSFWTHQIPKLIKGVEKLKELQKPSNCLPTSESSRLVINGLFVVIVCILGLIFNS